MRDKIRFYFDVLFYFFAISLLLIAIFNYFLPVGYALVYSILLSVLFCAIIFKVEKSKRNRQRTLNANSKTADALSEKLIITPKSAVTKLFQKALKNKNVSFMQTKNGILLTRENARLFTVFTPDGVRKSDILRARNGCKHGETCLIYAPEFPDEVIAFARRFDCKIVLNDKLDTLLFLSSADALPAGLTIQKVRKPFVEKFFQRGFSVKYFLTGLALLCFSFLTVYKIYYVVTGGVLILVSIFCKIKAPSLSMDDANELKL